ncbi:hypothetical protein MKW98_002017 [Papaver atlanticum]|uniref:Uncharacterized protein n=1 Tax=Papaver atlanticum TaxID=357466 RepID=A0AAD4SPL1_9MAGN|nr:hypothetical protein MKW98_002017 [Papaver atlanticum]
MATMSSAAVEVISKEIIKPTTPTPYQLRNFNISLFDQYMPPNYTPVILFYPAAVADNTGSKLHDDLGLLKRSLSETLVHFYPMAGRLKDNMVVDCNDQGVDFYEVKIKAKMCDFMMKPDELPLSLLLPSEVVSMNFVKEAQVIVQVNMFDCGGTAISLCISHKIADACTMSAFVRNWAGNTYSARCGGAPTTNRNLLPSFDSASLFPASEQLVCPSEVPPTPVSYPNDDSVGEKSVSKRFVFDAAKINSVREKLQGLMHDNYKCTGRPTRVDVVTASVWKAAMKSAPSDGLLSTVNHVVSFRKKMDPPFPDVSFGNLCAVITAAVSPGATVTSRNDGVEVQEVLEDQLAELVAQLRGEKYKVKGDKGSIEKIFLSFVGGDNALWMASWSKFGFYDADFGWGKPVWVTTDLSVVEPNQNLICMIDTKCGEGIEVSAKFLENDMAKFELHLSEILKLF